MCVLGGGGGGVVCWQRTWILFFATAAEKSTRNSKLRRLSGRFQTLIWRPGDTVQNLECPELSGRVDSPGRCASVQII